MGLVSISDVGEGQRFRRLPAVRDHPLGDADFWVIGLGPRLRGVDEGASNRVDGGIVGRLSTAGNSADDHIFSDFEVIRAVVGPGLEHPATAHANSFAAACGLQLLQHVSALLVRTDNAATAVARASCAIGVPYRLIADVSATGEGFENDFIVRHAATVSQEPKDMERCVLGVIGHPCTRVVDVVTTTHDKTRIWDT
ncbi:hypothetical protein D3C77_375840 [compost metagenome]